MPFFLSDLFFRSLFHIENTEWTILCMESRLRAAFGDLRFILSCSKLKSSAQCRGARWQTAHIQPLFRGMCARFLPYRFGFIFYNRHVSSPLLLVSYDVKAVKDAISSGLYSAMPN